MNEQDKIDAVIAVLEKRSNCCDVRCGEMKRCIANLEEEIKQRKAEIEYATAKKEGYQQAIDLLRNPIESIRIEL